MVPKEDQVSAVFAILLVIGAVCVFAYILRKIRKSEIKIADSTFWFLFAASLVLLAIFPQIAYFFSDLLQVQSPSNFVFLYVIAVLVIREFLTTVEISKAPCARGAAHAAKSAGGSGRARRR